MEREKWLRRLAAAVSASALVGGALIIWRLAGSRPTPERAATSSATVLRTQTTSHGNRVDVKGASVWTPRDVYYIEGTSIPLVFDNSGNVTWDGPPTSRNWIAHMVLWTMCMLVGFGAAAAAFF
jgi:hypothetical protein